MAKSGNMTWGDVANILHEFNVSDEEGLKHKLFRESNFVPCTNCLREYPLDKLVFLCGEPYCKRCSKAWNR